MTSTGNNPFAAPLPRGSVSVRKFTYDDFDSGNTAGEGFIEEAAPPAPPPTFSTEELEAARVLGDNDGYQRGVQETLATLEAETTRLLTQILRDMQSAVAEQQVQRDYVASEAVRLSLAVARKALPAMAETGALKEIEGLISRCLEERPDEARLVIRLHDAMLDPVRGRMETLLAESGFAGKPVLLADPALARSEIRIEWANGGVDWSFERQLSDIEAAARRLTKRPAKASAKAVETPIQETDE